MKPSAVCLYTIAVLLTLTPALQSQTTASLETIHVFSSFDSNRENSDGGSPYTALTLGSDGKLYGTTAFGGSGSNGPGTIFSITPAGALTTLHNFVGSDGTVPIGALVRGSDGKFYGTTADGGSANKGTVFSITPAGAFTILHNFSNTDNNYANPDGATPYTALVQGADGRFYGTTISGGSYGNGTIFAITAAGALTVLHNFIITNSKNINSDGEDATALVRGSDGNFYSTTAFGGSAGNGTVFRITPAGVLTTLYNFSAFGNNHHNGDGATPHALVRGTDGNFYGATQFGGSGNGGTIFRVTPAGVLTTLYNFSAYDSNAYNSDGFSASSLIQGTDGNFYGTTHGGGSNGYGTVFSMTPAGVLTTLHTFTYYDGTVPDDGLVQGSDGNFYGTTQSGGDGNNGTVFRLTLHPAFFAGEASLGGEAYYLSFSNNQYFGYYSYLTDPHYIYHFDLGYEYVFDADDGVGGVYFYDFTSQDFFYTSPTFPFPYLYDFGLDSVVYYYPDPTSAGHYNTDGYRFFYVFKTGQTIVK